MPTNPYTTGPFSSDLLAQSKVSHKAVWQGAGTRFLHPERERNFDEVVPLDLEQVYADKFLTINP